MSVIDMIFKPKENTAPFCSAVIVAAGNSQRMGKDKILMQLGDRPVIAHTLKAFQSSESINEIVVVTKYESIQEIADICNKYGITKVSKVLRGGNSRAESALIGVSEVSPKAKHIAIHDGARPFVTTALIDKVYHKVLDCTAVTPATFSTDTVRIVNAKGQTVETPNRDTVALIQTPQMFDADIIKGALTKAVDKKLKVTDDCSAVEAMGIKVTVVAGDKNNIKLTTAMDIYVAEKILADRGGRA